MGEDLCSRELGPGNPERAIWLDGSWWSQHSTLGGIWNWDLPPLSLRFSYSLSVFQMNFRIKSYFGKGICLGLFLFSGHTWWCLGNLYAELGSVICAGWKSHPWTNSSLALNIQTFFLGGVGSCFRYFWTISVSTKLVIKRDLNSLLLKRQKIQWECQEA